MHLTMLPKPIVKQVLVTAVLYFVTGKLALWVLAFAPSYAIAVWPPAGIALAALLLWGYRVLPGVALAELLLHPLSQPWAALLASPTDLLVLFLYPITSVIQAWLGSMLVKDYAQYPNPLMDYRLTVWFFVLAGPVASFFPALLSVYGLVLTHFVGEQALVFSFLSLWLGQSTGVVVFTPLFFIVFDRSQRIWRQRLSTMGVPLCGLLLLAGTACLWVQHYEAGRLGKIIHKQGSLLNDAFQQGYLQHLNALEQQKFLLGPQNDLPEADFLRFAQRIFNQHHDVMRLDWLSLQHSNNLPEFHNRYFATSPLVGQSHDFSGLAELAKKHIVTTRPLTVMGKQSLLILFPVIATAADSCHCLIGMVAETIDLKSFIASYIGSALAGHLSINITGIVNDQPEPLFQSQNHPESYDPLGLTEHFFIRLDKQQWLMAVGPDPQFLAVYYSQSGWQLLLGSGFLISFVSIGLLLLTGQNESIRLEVDKRTEELSLRNKQLAASEHQFRKLVQSQSAIVWRADPVSLRFLFVSDEAESLLGYPIEQWLNDADFCKHHLHKDDRENIMSLRPSFISKPINHEVEFRMIAADGRSVWLRNFVDVTRENDVVTELFGFMIDITRQKIAEEQLHLAATTFESQQGIMITDKDANILRVNKAFTEITGYSQEQVLGKNPRILSSGRHNKAFYQALWQQLSSQGHYEGELWNRRQNGELYPEWLAITAVKNADQELGYYVGVFSDITEKKDAEGRIHALAFYDPLTQLPNRRLLLDRFNQELSDAVRQQHYGAVIFLDLDFFKLLNDAKGHLVGDELLVQVANRLLSVLRKEDTPARLGGDEFVVLLHANASTLAIAADQAGAVAEKIKTCLNQPFILGHYEHQLSTSIGIALFPEHHDSPEVILQQADTAMYRSKASGRNTISFFHPSMQEAANLRLMLEHDIKKAIDNSRFILCYQAQVAANATVRSAEALIRWEDREKGTLLPMAFLPIAEESNLIVEIGRWVLLEACNQIKAWQDAGIAEPRIFVNVSVRQFRQPDFVQQVQHALDSSAISHELLGIEVTEQVLISDIKDTQAKMAALKALGISIAVDKFGTGYSSLLCLQQLPIDSLKIDRKFVKDILTDASDVVIVDATMDMARHLGLEVILEGVETAEQLSFLAQRGGQVFQGYYFSQPLPAAHYADKYFPPVIEANRH